MCLSQSSVQRTELREIYNRRHGRRKTRDRKGWWGKSTAETPEKSARSRRRFRMYEWLIYVA